MFSKSLLISKLSVVLLSGILILNSCQSNNPSTTPENTSDSVGLNEISKNVHEVIYPLPTPFELTNMLSTIGAAYIPGSLNLADNNKKYFKENAKAINLGVYCADLAYAATYDQKQEIKVYSGVIKTLIDDLGIAVDYRYLLSDDFKEKANNKDSLIKIITDTYSNTYAFLHKKSNPDLAVMMTTGMWIELMYIASNISEDTYHFSGMVKLIASQRDSYNKLLELLKSRNSNPDIKELEDKLLAIKPAFDKVDEGLKEKDYKLILKTVQVVRKLVVQ